MAKGVLFENPLVEALPDARPTGLRTKLFRKVCVDFHWHLHPEIELIHVRRGCGVRYVGRSMEPFAANDLCLIGSNVPHAFGSSPSQRRGAEWMVGHFLPEVWGDAFWRLPEMRQIARLLQRSQRGLHFEARELVAVRPLFEQIDGAPSGATRLTLWLEMLDRLAHCRKVRSLNLVSFEAEKTDARLQKILAWVEKHAGESDMTQARAAAEIHLSPQAFCRFFRQSTGRPFHRYVNEVRVARACGGLLQGERSIAEIAFETGFNNLANFNRRFREIAGVPPRDYRKMQGGSFH